MRGELSDDFRPGVFRHRNDKGTTLFQHHTEKPERVKAVIQQEKIPFAQPAGHAPEHPLLAGSGTGNRPEERYSRQNRKDTAQLSAYRAEAAVILAAAAEFPEQCRPLRKMQGHLVDSFQNMPVPAAEPAAPAGEKRQNQAAVQK